MHCDSFHVSLQGRGKRRRAAGTEPYLRVLLMRQGVPTGSELGLWVEHHVHLNLPEFIITRYAHH